MPAAAPSQAKADGRLYLLFRLGADRYALDVREIVEVLPLQPLKQLPEAPSWVAGLFEHRGRAVPAIDLSARATGRPAARRASTRLAVVAYPVAPACRASLGLLLERATETLRLPEAGFAGYGLDRGAAAYLGPVQTGDGLLQRVEVAGLLPEDVRAMLFPDAAAVG